MLTTQESRRGIIDNMINNPNLRSGIEHSLSDFCNVRRETVRDALFHFLEYRNILSRNKESSAEEIERKGKEVEVVQQRLLQKRAEIVELDWSWWRAYGTLYDREWRRTDM